MKVFRIHAERPRYQVIGSAPGLVERHPLTTADASYIQGWEPLPMSVDDPRKARGDFMFLPLEYMVCSRSTSEIFENCVQDDVQILPARLNDDTGEYCLWNITNYIDALDSQRSEFRPPFRSIPVRWIFHPSRFSRATLFRDPHRPNIPMVVTGLDDVTNDFYARYHQLNSKGLAFELVWEST